MQQTLDRFLAMATLFFLLIEENLIQFQVLMHCSAISGANQKIKEVIKMIKTEKVLSQAKKVLSLARKRLSHRTISIQQLNLKGSWRVVISEIGMEKILEGSVNVAKTEAVTVLNNS